MKKRIIAIDGPAGSGKSSVSKQVARKLGYGYLDTGAAYRALAWASLENPRFSLEQIANLDLDQDFAYSISLDPDAYLVKVGEVDVTQEIRLPRVAEYVSKIAAIAPVRSFMKRLTEKLVSECEYPGVVVEGRDITTVVFPNADIRLLLTASEEVRLKRRSAELTQEQAKSLTGQVSERDASDSKVVEFMTPAAGVHLVDTSDLNFEESVDAVLALI